MKNQNGSSKPVPTSEYVQETIARKGGRSIREALKRIPPGRIEQEIARIERMQQDLAEDR